MRAKLLKSVPLTLFLIFIFALLFIYRIDNSGLTSLFLMTAGIYWVYRNVSLVVPSIIGLIIYKKNSSFKALESIPTQLYALAVYGESLEVLQRSLDSILNMDYPSNKIYISVSFEERRLKLDEKFGEVKETLEEVYGSRGNIIFTVHPEGLKGEVSGAASNKNWASREGIKFLKTINKIEDDSLITIPDADTCFSPTYAMELAGKASIHTEGYKFFQTQFYTVSNNFKNLSLIPKILSLTLSQSIVAASNWLGYSRYTFSCFSLRVSSLERAGYWNTALSIDDTPFYWRLMKSVNRQPVCVVLNSRLSVNGIEGESFKRVLVNQYQQLYRWGWGADSVYPGFITILLSNQSPIYKFINIIRVVDRFILIKLLPIIIFTGFLLGKSNFWGIVVAVNIFFLAVEVLVINVTLVFFYDFRLKYSIFSIIFFPISLLVLTFYGFIPYFHAAFDIMRGKESHESVVWTNKK